MMKKLTLALVSLVSVHGSSPVGLTYEDWDGAQSCHVISSSLPTSEDAVIREILDVAAAGDKLKVVGAGHSFSGIQLADDNGDNATIYPAVDGAGARLMSLDRFAGVVGEPDWSEDGSFAEVTVRAGSRLRDLNSAFEDLGLAFVNLGATAAQSIAGATATGTHGTGRKLGSLSTDITRLRLVSANGTVREVSSSSSSSISGSSVTGEVDDGALFSVARVGLGALGVATEVTVRVVPSFKLRKTSWNMPLEQLLDDHDDLYNQYERFQWNWLPYSGAAGVLVREVTDDAVTGCWSSEEATAASLRERVDRARAEVKASLKAAVVATSQSAAVGAKAAGAMEAAAAAEAEKGLAAALGRWNRWTYSPGGTPSGDTAGNSSCVDVSYKALVDSNSAYEERTLYTEMEMFIPVEHTVAAVRDFIAYQDSVRPLLDAIAPHAEESLYCQVRYVAADDIPLSPVRGRAVAVLSMIAMGDKDRTAPAPLFALFAKELERLTSSKYEGVPHWGKKNWATKDELLEFYGTDAWALFENARQAMDPSGVFLNPYLRDRGIGEAAAADVKAV